MMLKAAIFYVDGGMVASTDLWWIQSTFYTLRGIFDRVYLRKNVRKTVGVVCKPYWASGVQAGESYTLWMTWEGHSFKERHK